MRPVVGFYILGASLQNSVQSTKTKMLYTTVRFCFRTDTLLAGAGMRPVIGFYIFCASSQKLCQDTKHTKTYTTVRLSLCRDALLAGARMRPVIRFYSFDNCKRRSQFEGASVC